MDAASASEKTFATRAAVASKNVYEWLDELRDWPWPAEGGLGFQTPAFADSKFSLRGRSGSTAQHDPEETPTKAKNLYVGCLPESDLARYEARIEQIQAELDKLEFEDIKRHVLHDHIIPLSRSGTPASPTFDRPFGMSAASYVKMDDLTAVITATVVQTLPNLSKLLRLMNAWMVRLTVLRRVPSWLSCLVDAESVIKMSWDAVKLGSETQIDQASDGQSLPLSTFTKHDFEVMKMVLEKKIPKAARMLDHMLDTLEGRDDTLPDEWLDRMEVVEREFSEWVVACEKKIHETELAAQKGQTKTSSGVVISVEHADHQDAHHSEAVSGNRSNAYVDADQPIPTVEEPDSMQNTDASGNRYPSDIELDADDLLLAPTSDNCESSQSRPSTGNSRPGTAVSNASTVIHTRSGDPSKTPELLPQDSSRKSPHTPPRETRSVSLTLSDMPPVPEDPEDDNDSLQTPLTSCYDSSSQDLRSPIVLPIMLSDASGGGDDHLRKQISEILENIPAKIHLSSMSHLNPPDLQLPYSKSRPAAEKSTRSKSSMSSRSNTPSFMLAPASRTRQQRGNQDIKMYHLSRANGEAPIKLFIRCVGERGERVMVRVGGGWADLGEYLKEYAIHHGRRSNPRAESRVEVRDIPRSVSSLSNRTSASPPSRTSPPSRPASALDISPIYVKKTRKTSAGEDLLGPRLPRTPLAYGTPRVSEPSSAGSVSGSTGRSRSSSRVSWTEEDSSLGMAGPNSSRKTIPQESLEWVESIKEKVRAASGGSDLMRSAASAEPGSTGKFGELGRVGGTKRVFRKAT